MKVVQDLYGQIRKYHVAGWSNRKIAKKLKIDRKTVAKYVNGEILPGQRRGRCRGPSVMTEKHVNFVIEILKNDKNVPKKQRHNAVRIFTRLKLEMDFQGGESTVRRLVHELKMKIDDTFIPLVFSPGEAIQVDWGFVKIILKGIETLICIFCARLCYSCKSFALAYRRSNEESFLEAFTIIFEKIGGVPKRIIFDNAKVAVKEGFGRFAVMQNDFELLCAHYACTASFCNVRQGHEKGLVENLVYLIERQVFTPIQEFENMDQVNEHIERVLGAYNSAHKIRGKPDTIDAMFETEKSMMTPLPEQKLDVARRINVRVNKISTVYYDTNQYSVPAGNRGHSVAIKAYPEKIEIYYKGKIISEHNRLFGKHEISARLRDYLPLLETRPRSVLNALPVRQNLSNEAFDELKANIDNSDKVIEILYREAGLPYENKNINKQDEPMINDAYCIDEVDLTKYDQFTNMEGGI